ncbi:MAG: deoxyhypusine synthase family protein [Candidatus Altiarchaeota archaeon]|nr:deoxyhypusine synthase family protein [Candidatus Altiarchaeota archaeon]
MEFVSEVKWKPDSSVSELVAQFKANGFQSTELNKASSVLYKIWSQKAKVILSFTSNMVTAGLRSLFAQLISLDLVDAVVTTAGSIEEDIMKAKGEKFPLTRFRADDIELHEKGHNRIGNIAITNDSYGRFEGVMKDLTENIFSKKESMSVSEFLYEVGGNLSDENSILYQANKKNIPVFCPAITDGSIGFHLYLAKDKNPKIHLDVIDDFKKLMFVMSPDDTKGFIALGGGVSKHFGLLTTMINGGADYAIYMTTSSGWGGSLSGASTNEAKSWGKIKDDSDSVTVLGDVSINFPLASFSVLDRLKKEGVI